MRIAGTVEDSIVDGPGLRFTIFTQGCFHNCQDCHNPQTHNPSGGDETTVDALISQMLANPITDGLTLSGGEPMEQAKDCLTLAQTAHQNGLNVWCYSGYTFEHLITKGTPEQQALLKELDVLIDGKFIKAEASLLLQWSGSKNQRVLDVQKSLVTGSPTLWSR